MFDRQLRTSETACANNLDDTFFFIIDSHKYFLSSKLNYLLGIAEYASETFLPHAVLHSKSRPDD